MATYVVSFRLEYDGTYSDRYSSVVDAIRKEAEAGSRWEELTSLFIFKSSKSSDSIASSIYVGSLFDITKDAVLVVNASSGSFATRGKIEYPATLASQFSGNAVRLGVAS
jgi:hypothetical protein